MSCRDVESEMQQEIECFLFLCAVRKVQMDNQ